jgi:hypothetical protein
VLFHRKQISQYLSWMKFIGQAVIDRHACISCKLFHNLLAETPIFYGIINTAQYAGRVLHRLLVSNLRATRSEISNVRTLIICGDFETDPGSC